MVVIDQYPCAFDENNNLVFIESAVNRYRDSITFHCPYCGSTMYPTYGGSTFAHKHNDNCDIDSFLLVAATHILATRFNSRRAPFKVGLMSKRYCKEAKLCKENKRNCAHIPQKYREFNLLDYYDLPATILDSNSPYRVLLQSSDKRRNNILIAFSTSSKQFELKGSQDQIIEIHLRYFTDLKRLQSCSIIQGPSVRFYNFKDRPMTPEMICMEYKRLHKPLPPCKSLSDDLPLKRYVLYPDGQFDCFDIGYNGLNNHDPACLIDITYHTNYFKGFDPEKELARKYWRARFCNYCEHFKTSVRNTTWCEAKMNGNSKYGTFNRTKGPTCPEFIWRTNTAAVDWNSNDVQPKEGVDYHIWINPALKK